MTVELTFGEIARLKRRLVEEGLPNGERKDLDAAVQDALDWFAQLPASERDRIGVDGFAALATTARSDADSRARRIALGALRVVAKDAGTHPERARFAARFAIQRLLSLGTEAPLWKRIRLSGDDEEQAQALFEAAKGDRSYSDEQLISAVTTFAAEHATTPGAYGRLSSDLEFLVQCIREPKTSTEHRETARAALTYFVEDADAIPDDLGAVGLLDDAVIVQRAVAEINPERGEMTTLLDEVVGRWPFIGDVVFESTDGAYPISEFVVVNTALLLDDVLADGTTGVAIVVPGPGPLPLLCGFLRAVAELRDQLPAATVPTFSRGERLRNRANGAEVEFVCYGKMDARGTILECAREDATHFQYRTGPTGSRSRRIEDLSTFMRSPRHAGRLRGGNKSFDRDAMPMGPLERLFGRAEPVVLPAERRRVVVVMDRGEARELATGLSLFGCPLKDVLPMSGARLLRNAWSNEPWTTGGRGGEPVLTVVRSCAEALELVDDGDRSVASVVARVRVGTTDVANIADIRARGVPVVAVITSADREAHTVLAAAGLRFWVWDERWFGVLHWPISSMPHAVADYEGWLRTVDRAEVHVEAVSLPELDEASEYMKQLGRDVSLGEDEEDDMLLAFLADAETLLHRIRREVTPVSDESQRAMTRGSRRVEARLRSGEHWWSETQIEAATRVANALERAVAVVSVANPKWAALQRWLTANDNGTVICTPTLGSALEAALAPAVFRWTPASEARMLETALVPRWRKGDRMDRLLHPPAAAQLTLLLYGPEVEWFEAAKRRRVRVIGQLERIASQASPFRPIRPRATHQPASTEPESRELDDFLACSRRAALLRRTATEPLDCVEARLVHFAGGAWAAFSRDHRVHTITHLLGHSDAERQELRETPAWDLQVDDIVVLVKGSDRDVIRAAVDERIPDDIRSLASTWRRALCRYAREHEISEIVEQLRAAGCRRTVGTVSRWLSDDTTVRPRHGRYDIAAVARVTRDAELEEMLDDCADACDELFRLHSVVGKELTQRVLASARDWIAAGISPDEVVEVDERLTVVSVDAIDPETLKVPRSSLGLLRGSTCPE